MVLQLRGLGSPRSVSIIRDWGKNNQTLNPSIFTSSWFVRWTSSLSIAPMLSSDLLLLLKALHKNLSCCLTQHRTVLSLIKLRPLMFCPCICKMQLCNLPAKSALASRDHTIPFPPGFQKEFFCATCLTFGTKGLPPFVLLKGSSSNWTSTHGPLNPQKQIPGGHC